VLVLAQLTLVEGRSYRAGIVQILVRLHRRAMPVRLVFLHLDAHAVGQHPHRFGKGQPLGLHHEADGVPLLVAAEAVEEPALVVDVEARRLLLVEGTQPGERTPLAGELHRLADDSGDVSVLAYLVYGVRRDHCSKRTL